MAAASPSTSATELLARITERLGSRVKGLTAVFCVLLLARPNPEPAARRACKGGIEVVAKGLVVVADK
jgi:hypothetical protein